MLNLREKLNSLPDIKNKDDFDQQKNIIEGQSKDEYNHNIEHSRYCKCEFPTLQMCFSYALGIPNNILKVYYFNYRGFLKFLIDEKFIMKNDSGNLILYGDYSSFEHAGLRINNTDRVISQWGSGHIWEHNINDVPEMYGKYESYILPSSNEKILQKLEEYADKIKYKRKNI
jgi:hypothetical protein